MAIKRIEKDDLVAKGALDNLTKGAEESRAAIELLKKSLEAVVELSKQTKTKVKSSSPKDVKSQKELNELTERSNKLAKSKLTIDKELLKEKERLKQKTQAQTKALKEEVALEKTQANSLNAIRAASKKLVKERNNLNLSTSKGAKRLKEINAQLDKNNNKLQKNASALGKQKMNIGNYGSAVGKLKGALGQLGLAFGVFSLIRGSFNIVKDFGQAQADLASVLGVSTEQMSSLTEQAKQLGATTTFTASQVSELQKEFAKLGFTQSEIENVTEATLLLAEATGTELARAAEVAGGVVNAFGLETTDTQHIVDVMAKSFSTTALDMEKFAETMKTAAPIAKVTGVSLDQATAAAGVLANNMISGSKAGTDLKKVFSELVKDGKPLNESLEDIALEMNAAGTKAEKLAIAEDLVGDRAKGALVILTEQREALVGLTDEFGNAEGSAEKMAETQRDTLGGSIKLLQSAWEGLVLKFEEGTGTFGVLKDVIAFIASNLDDLVKGFIVLGTAFGVYALINKTVKAFNALNLAMKANPYILIASAIAGIAAAVSLWTSELSSAEKIQKNMLDIQKETEKSILGEKTQLEELLKIARNKNLADKEREKAIIRLNQISPEYLGNLTLETINTKEATKSIGNYLIALEKKGRAIAIQNKQQLLQTKLLDAQQKTLQEYADDLGIFDNAFGAPKLKKETIKAVKDEIKAINELLKTELESNNISLADLGLGVNSPPPPPVTPPAITINKSTEALKKFKSVAIELDKVNKPKFGDVNFKSDFERNVLEAKYNLLLNEEGATKQELIDLNTKLITAQGELNKVGKSASEQQVIDLETAKQIRALDVTNLKTTENKKTEILKSSIDFATELYTKAADTRISKIDEEMAAAKKQSDYFKQLAAEGNISARESLAEQNQIIAQANAKKEREEKRKQRILLATSILQAYSANLANGDKSAEALTKALTSSTIVTQFVNALPAFEDGTENTSIDGKGKNVDGKGGFHAVLHQNERVLTSDQNNKIGNYSNNEVAAIMEKHRLGQLMPDSQIMLGFGTQELVNKLMNVENKLDQVTKAIQNKPVPNIELGEITQSYMVINKRIESGKGTTTSKFKVK